MSQEWKKIELTQDLGNISKNVQAYVDQLKSSLEEETLKLQRAMDIFLVELQKHNTNTDSK